MRMLWCSILSAVLLVSLGQANPLSNPPAAGSSAQSGSEAANLLESTKDGYPLPENVHPNDYTIKLEPHLVEGDFTFSGESNIDVNIGVATNTIVLHAAGLKIKEDFTSLVAVEENTLLKPTKHSLDLDNKALTIEFAEPIKAGTYTLNLKYTGTLEEEPKGFYRKARVIGEKKVWEAFTEFNSSYARLAFPCFDETAMKARFTISINHPENYAVRSTVLKARDTGSDNSLTQFATTERISTDEINFEVYMITVAPRTVTDKPSGSSTTDEPSGSSTTDESSGSSTTDESSGSSTTDEPSGSSTTDEPSGSSTTDEPSGSSTTDEPSGSSTTDESSASSTTDESSGSSTTDERSGSSTTDGPSGSSTTDESSGSSTTDGPSGSSTTDESSGSSTTDEPSGSSTTDEPSGSSTTDEPSGSSTADEPSGSSTTDESSGSSTANEPSGSSTTDEPSGSSTANEPSGSSTTDESSGSSTTDESSGSSTPGTNGVTAAPSKTGAANISLPTLPFTIFICLLARLVVAQVL